MMRRGVLAGIAAAVAALFGLRSGGAAQAAAASPQILETLPFPVVTVPGTEALARWEQLRQEGKGWPLIVGDDDALAMIVEIHGSYGDEGRGPQAILAAAAQITEPAAALRKLREDDARTYGDSDPESAEWLPPVGEWPAPGKAEVIGLTVASDVLSGKPFERAHILLLPTTDGAEVPAYLGWGDWNECPSPEMHVAMLRDWNRRYGIQVIGLSGDTLNLRVSRRPGTRDEALALATEQYFYCEDLVVQGTQTLGALAAALIASDWWFFWWD